MIVYNYIDIDFLLLDLEDTGVTKTVFPFIALYILFGNSLIEETFFRGLTPSFIEHPKLRLLVPSLLFALYHIVIFLPWFSPPLLVLAILGLWFAGYVFQLVNKQQTIFTFLDYTYVCGCRCTFGGCLYFLHLLEKFLLSVKDIYKYEKTV